MKPRAPQLRLFALPAVLFEPAETGSDELHRTLSELRVAVRHLGKHVNPLNDRRRIHGLLQRLDDIVPASSRYDARLGQSVCIGRGYLDLLGHLAARNAANRPRWLGRCLTEPGQVADMVDELSLAALDAERTGDRDIQAMLQFIESVAQPSGCGLLELPALTDQRDGAAPARPAPDQADHVAIESEWETALHMLEIEARERAAGTRASREAGFQRKKELCRRRVRAAIEHGGVIDALRQDHPTLTDVLAEEILRPRGELRVDVPVVYGCGAPAPGFPLRCAERAPAAWKADHELHVALISMRHVHMDVNVERAYLTNAEATGNLPMDAQDRICFERGLTLLRELRVTYGGRRVMVYLHHTGLEAAVVGFYRAAIHTILESQRPVSLLRVWWERVSVRWPHLARLARWFERRISFTDHPGPWLRVTPVYEQENGPATHGPVWPASAATGDEHA